MALKAQRDADAARQTKAEEKSAVVAMVTSGLKDQTPLDKFVREVLLPRHLREMASLTERLDRETEAACKEAGAKVSLDCRVPFGALTCV